MDKKILIHALVTMGYRKLDVNNYGKPIGFSVIAAIINEENNQLEIRTIIEDVNAIPHTWASKVIDLTSDKEKEELYHEYTHKIAYAEVEAHIKDCVYGGNPKSFAFRTDADIYLEA